MTLGEIKIEALKLMFASYERDFIYGDLEEEAVCQAYRDYLINMPGAVNRAFAIIENKGVLPCKRRVIEGSEKTSEGNYFAIQLGIDEGFEACKEVDRVVFRGRSGEYLPNFPFELEENMLILQRIYSGDSYTVMYRPFIPRVTSATDNDTELSTLGIPDNIAAFIPYFIKGELFREEEPGEATLAHNIFLQALDDIIPETAVQGSVDTIFGAGDVVRKVIGKSEK